MKVSMIPNLNAVRDAVAFRMDWVADQHNDEVVAAEEIRELREALEYLDALARGEEAS